MIFRKKNYQDAVEDALTLSLVNRLIACLPHGINLSRTLLIEQV
jgi:hypothetical protein